jgi:ABC-2 type transport system permease protein/oleandomycin transport system permease protein
MTTATVASPVQDAAARPGASALRDTLTMSKRNLRRISRTPQLVAASSVLPISFTMMCRYVFGRSVHVPGQTYVDYLIPAMLLLAPLFGGTTAIAMAEDMAGGMIERFRSLPIARSAVLAGRTVADTARGALVVALILGVGALYGFRFHNGFLPGLAAFGLILAFSFAIAWEMAWIGMTVKDAQSASVAGFVPIFILTFTGGGLVPIATLPGWLQAFAHVQPVSVTITTLRALTQGGPIYHTLWQSLAWTVGILAAFMTLTIRRYRNV